jgi:TM2 domain-containing membrane protein YozV
MPPPRIKHQQVRGDQVMSGIPYPNTQAMFYEQYESTRRDEVVGILLALFLGTFGIHHFYLRRTGLGILYCCFFWTGITALLGFIECFFMPGRVREFNAIQAAGIAAALGMNVPPGWGWPVNVSAPPTAAGAASGTGQALPLAGTLIACKRCQQTNVMGSRFCSACGEAL